MIDHILESARINAYDFRRIASPNDPLKHLFKDWLPYYQFKSAITHVLKPRQILGIGVRYGYSAQAFIDGYPETHYLGIDKDSDKSLGTMSGFDYAATTLPKKNCRLLRQDSQKLSILPGDIHDLIHVDGCRQDGKGTYHDLELAIAQGRWVLLDYYFGIQKNFMESNMFLQRHQDIIEYSTFIPDYAGTMLIKIKQSYLADCQRLRKGDSNKSTSQPLAQHYNDDYYLRDCGGHESFCEYGPEIIKDNRLLSILALTSLKKEGNLLDLGCGRGEVAFQAARHGFIATGIDYSSSSISIAEKQRKNVPELMERLDYQVGDVTTFTTTEEQDVVVAGDLIEHLSPQEVEDCYARVSENLKKDGIFVVHTFPNAWYYRYEYPRRRKAADAIDAFLPSEPRSRFEKLMHINEQNPRLMRRQLLRHFPHVTLWFGSPEDPAGSLQGRNTPRRLIAYRDIFALASHSALPSMRDIAKCLTTKPIQPEEVSGKISIHLLSPPAKVQVNESINLNVEIINNSSSILTSLSFQPIRISYHWINQHTGEITIFEGIRTPLPRPLVPKGTGQFSVSCISTGRPGHYHLNLTLVQEGVAWWDSAPYGVLASVDIEVE